MSPDMNGAVPKYANGIPVVPDKDNVKIANIVRRKLTGYVGFANLPNQWHRKSVRKGFNFNVMVVGIFPGDY
jgi:septin 7